MTETLEEYVERNVAEYERDVYEGAMPVENKSVLRAQLRKEYRFNEWEARDYLPADNGEPPKGANW